MLLFLLESLSGVSGQHVACLDSSLSLCLGNEALVSRLRRDAGCSCGLQ